MADHQVTPGALDPLIVDIDKALNTAHGLNGSLNPADELLKLRQDVADRDATIVKMQATIDAMSTAAQADFDQDAAHRAGKAVLDAKTAGGF